MVIIRALLLGFSIVGLSSAPVYAQSFLFEEKGLVKSAGESIVIEKDARLKSKNFSKYRFSGETVTGEIQLFKRINTSVAKFKIKTDTVAIENSFAPRKNPYKGQLTEVIECRGSLKLFSEVLKLQGEEARLYIGGANSRKVFGSCTMKDSSFIGGMINYYSLSRGVLVKIKLFVKIKDEASLARQKTMIKAIVKNLLESKK